MLTKFLSRFAMLGVAFLVTCITEIELARAYLYVDLAWVAMIVAVFVAIIAIGGAFLEENALAGVVNFFVILIMGGLVVLNLLISFGVSKLFNIDFYTAYVVIDFIFALIPKKKEYWSSNK